MEHRACEVPQDSAIGQRFIAAASFRDAYRIALTNPDASVIDIFFGVFGHHPRWMKQALIARNRLAAATGLRTAKDEDILRPARKAHYQVGDTIGAWPIFGLTPTELVAGRDNGHLDFRLSVWREPSGPKASVVISTVCAAHNHFGRIYLRLVVPFHKWGMKMLIRRAAAAGRL